MILQLYRILTLLAAPFLRLLIIVRVWRKLEEEAHIAERRGLTALSRPQGHLLWIHAASVGEMRSILPLAQHVLTKNPNLTCLVTTVTVTAANLVRRAGIARLIHQYAPFDHPAWVAQFLDHWKPNAAIWVESELWPNLMLAADARQIPMMMVNARLSERSAARWACARKTIARLLGLFQSILAQSGGDAARLENLGARNVVIAGNMKFAGTPLSCDDAVLQKLRNDIGARPVILFASTHDGEETMAARMHQALSKKHANLLSIIMPRHPVRGETIANQLQRDGLNVARRSLQQPITSNTHIYLADTLGEPGLFYRLAPIVYMGNSLITTPGGGHNPIEPAQLGCAVVYGPHMWNFGEIDEVLRGAHAAIMVADEAALQTTLDMLLSDPARMSALASAAQDFVTTQNGVMDKIITHLRNPLLRAGITA